LYGSREAGSQGKMVKGSREAGSQGRIVKVSREAGSQDSKEAGSPGSRVER
jgi:hypothetical protein